MDITTKKNKRKFLLLPLLGLAGMLIGIVIMVAQYNLSRRNQDMSLEITFVDPHQAVIFWKTDEITLGSLQYGTTAAHRPERVDQTSSTPGQIHTVVIDEIPESGVYATIHNQSDGWFFLQKPFVIKFDPETFE